MRVLPLLLSLLFAGCGAAGPSGAPAGPGAAPVDVPAAGGAAGAADPFAVVGSLGRERLPDEPPDMPLRQRPFPPRGAGVPPMPDRCAAYVGRRPAAAEPCADRGAALAALDRALGAEGSAERDAALLALESCAALPAGLVRALRAELAPVACGDGLVEPLLAAPPTGLDGMVYDALFGLGLAARLARTVSAPPELEPPYDKQRVRAFHEGPLLDWGKRQAEAIQQMSALGVKLGHYGKAIVGVEAGMADMRFVEMVRSLPVPDEYRQDQELLDQYYGALDVALEPRKSRGRDAALVGLRGLAYVGVIADPRVARARQLLAQMYGGRPIDALDALLLPARPPAPAETAEQRLAAELPTFYAARLFDAAAATDVPLMQALTRRGLPLPHRIALRDAELDPALRQLVARARLELGRIYWRAVDVDESVRLLSTWPASAARPGEASLLLALGIALRGGPADAAEMIRTAPVESLGIGRVVALDAIASETPPGPLAGLAAFDAAVVLQVAAPPRADRTYWQELAARFRTAAGLLASPEARATAEARARDAAATAAAIR